MNYTYSAGRLEQLRQLAEIKQEYYNAIYHIGLISHNMMQEENNDWILSYTEMLGITNPLVDMQCMIEGTNRLTDDQKATTPRSLYGKREEWFMKQIGKRIYRNHICTCKSCKAIDEHGLIVQDKFHASYLCTLESDYNSDGCLLRYISQEDFNSLAESQKACLKKPMP